MTSPTPIQQQSGFALIAVVMVITVMGLVISSLTLIVSNTSSAAIYAQLSNEAYYLAYQKINQTGFALLDTGSGNCNNSSGTEGNFNFSIVCETVAVDPHFFVDDLYYRIAVTVTHGTNIGSRYYVRETLQAIVGQQEGSSRGVIHMPQGVRNKNPIYL